MLKASLPTTAILGEKSTIQYVASPGKKRLAITAATAIRNSRRPNKYRNLQALTDSSSIAAFSAPIHSRNSFLLAAGSTLFDGKILMNPLIVGTRVHCILYGGEDGIVYAIHGEQRPDTVRTLASVVMAGGNAQFDIVWENGTESLRISEAIIHSVQWRVLPGIATAEEITALREYAAQEQERRERKAQQDRERFCAEVEALRADPQYAHLQQGDDQHSGKLAAKNIRTELKAAFSAVKFSVRKDHHASVTVTWRDGPTTEEVEAITNDYLPGSFNSMEDMYETAVSPWTTVFGGSKYISCVRSYSFEALQQAVGIVAERHAIGAVTIESFESGESCIRAHNSDDSRLVYDFLEKKGPYAESIEVVSQ